MEWDDVRKTPYGFVRRNEKEIALAQALGKFGYVVVRQTGSPRPAGFAGPSSICAEYSRIMQKKASIYQGITILLAAILVLLVFSGCSDGKGGSPGQVTAADQIQVDESRANEVPVATARAPVTIEEGASRSASPKKGAQNSAASLIPAVVTRVVDGDTIYVRLADGREEKVRFTGVDTPESTREVGPYGQEAAAYTSKRLDGKKVCLELDVGERDKYGRLLAYVWLEPPADDSETEVRAKMFNAGLLLAGMARVMIVPPNVKYADLFVKLQREAREAGKGLWGLPVWVNSELSLSVFGGTPAHW